MNRNRLTLVLGTLLVGGIALAGCRQQAEPAAVPPATTEPAAPAATEPFVPETQATVEVTDVQLGTEAGTDRRIAEPRTGFAADDDTIVAAVHTSTGTQADPASGTLTARWTYQDGQLVDERTETFSFTGEDVTNFRIVNPDAWPSGSYTLEVSLDGDVVETREFTVE